MLLTLITFLFIYSAPIDVLQRERFCTRTFFYDNDIQFNLPFECLYNKCGGIYTWHMLILEVFNQSVVQYRSFVQWKLCSTVVLSNWKFCPICWHSRTWKYSPRQVLISKRDKRTNISDNGRLGKFFCPKSPQSIKCY